MLWFTISSVSSHGIVHRLVYLILFYGSPSHLSHLKLWITISFMSSEVMVQHVTYLFLCYGSPTHLSHLMLLFTSHLPHLILWFTISYHPETRVSICRGVLMEAPVIRARSHSLPSTTYTLVWTHNTHPPFNLLSAQNCLYYSPRFTLNCHLKQGSPNSFSQWAK